MRDRLLSFGCCCALWTLVAPAWAEMAPTRPLRVIVLYTDAETGDAARRDTTRIMIREAAVEYIRRSSGSPSASARMRPITKSLTLTASQQQELRERLQRDFPRSLNYRGQIPSDPGSSVYALTLAIHLGDEPVQIDVSGPADDFLARKNQRRLPAHLAAFAAAQRLMAWLRQIGRID